MSMTVDEIRNVVLLFSNPTWSGAGTVPNTVIRNISALASQLAYSAIVTDNITVLTSKYSQTDNGVIQGLLYVPDMDDTDPCRLELTEYIPTSAVRQKNLPPASYNLIALAPWVNVNCTKTLLTSARFDPLRAFIFYHPNNSTDRPPPATSSVWNLNDDGLWKTQNHYPIYAVPGKIGWEMMQQLSKYSGNVSAVPYGANISDLYSYDPSDYVRIWTSLTVSTPANLPVLWVFLVISLGLLLAIIALTSTLMHFVQGRRRVSLRRRVVAGEVNLEAMGIKRMTVPLDHVKKFPVFTYYYEPDNASMPASPSSVRPPRRSRPRPGSHDAPDAALPTRALTVSEKGLNSPRAGSFLATDYQPVCEICLEPYQNRLTVIRELSCGHIFHPLCIDEFLSRNSSLCPLCKACMLPKGHCPKITNGMVRRERAVGKLRDRIVVDESDVESNQGRMHSWGSNIKKRLFFSHGSESSSSPSNSTELQPQQQQSLPQAAPPPPSPLVPPKSRQAPAAPSRQATSDAVPAQRVNGRRSPTELARRRMRELAGGDIDDGESHVSRWQAMRRKVFPGF